MRVLSLWQPWATLVVLGVKRYETRPRPTRIRERIAIHATKATPQGAVSEALKDWLCAKYGIDWFNALPHGAIVGTVVIEDCVPTEKAGFSVSALEHMLGDYRAGRSAWRLTGASQYVPPVPAVGKQGFWNFDLDGRPQS